MAALPEHAVVSFWLSQYDLAPKNFACSGIFVGNKSILTVAHVFDEDRPLWVRPQAGMGQSYRVVRTPDRHPDLDAALVEIDIMPPGCLPAQLDKSDRLPAAKGTTFFINGFFNGLYEKPYSMEWLAYEADDRQHRLDSKQPRGHSGSGLSRDGKLWGLTINHYTDPNIHRGCALSISQLVPWLEDYLQPHSDAATSNPEYDVAEYVQNIFREVGDNKPEPARILMLRLVDHFPTTADRLEAAMISRNINEFREIEKKRSLNASESRQFNEYIERMLKLAARIMGRLSGEANG